MSAQQADQSMITVKHIRAVGYRNEFVGGMFSAGPLNDGLYRVTLFRDAFDVVHEQLAADPNVPGKALGAVQQSMEVPLVREDVVTLIMNRDAMIGLGRDLIKQAGGVIEEVAAPNEPARGA